MSAPDSLPWTGDAEADQLLARNPFALVTGMLLDQQFPMERAFYGPHLLQQRLQVDLLAPEVVVATDPERLEQIFKGPPAIHRFPGSMARRTQELARFLIDHYDGDTARIWETAESGADLLRRLEDLPGFGKAKARIFVGVVGKRLEAGPPGWEEVAADWPSIADVARWEDVTQLRQQKRDMKAARGH
ncbi:MAG TPA: HhH-GPD-type base excision DNA repair protein [Acidimicrobiia bacterium]|nr:HhH-GPD-type base excision DNA repair protein [Acidimicrobiia bacterium]